MTGLILMQFFFSESLNRSCGPDNNNILFLCYGPVLFLDDWYMALFLAMCAGSHDDLYKKSSYKNLVFITTRDPFKTLF